VTVDEGVAPTTPTYLVEQYADMRAMEQSSTAGRDRVYLVVSIEAVPTRVGNPVDETYRISIATRWTCTRRGGRLHALIADAESA